MAVIESRLPKSGSCGITVGYADPCPGRHGSITLTQVEAARRTAEWWHARASLSGADADYDAYLRAAAELQDKRQYCTDWTLAGGIA